jgi:hypothetical protein
MHRFLDNVSSASSHVVCISQLLYLSPSVFQRLLDTAVVPHHLVHPSFKLLIAAVHYLLTFTVDTVNQTVEVALQTRSGLVPTLLDNHSPVISPPLYYLKVVHVLSTLQLSQRQLLMHTFQTLRQSLKHMRAMLFTSRAGNAEQRVLTGEANHSQLLLRMDRTEGLR